MEAARVAAIKGHTVTLYEKSERLGGQLLAAYTPSFKSRLRKFVEWQIRQLSKLGVNIVFGKEIDENSPELYEAEQIIIALGATSFCPNIPGVDHPNVIDVMEAHIHPEKITGEKIVIAGGGLSGCDSALELAMTGKKVTIVEMLPSVAANALLDNRNPLMFKLADYHVDIKTNSKIIEMKDNAVVIKNCGVVEELMADTIITAFGMRSLNTLADKIADRYPNSSIVGDCNKVGQVAEAVRSGFFAGWSIR